MAIAKSSVHHEGRFSLEAAAYVTLAYPHGEHSVLIKALLGGSDCLNTLQQLVKIVKGEVWIFQPFIVKQKAFADEFAKVLRCPDAKLCRHLGLYAISHRDDKVKIIIV